MGSEIKLINANAAGIANGAYFDSENREPLLVQQDSENPINNGSESFGCWY